MYGLTDEYEMLAEMANPAFRRALKAKRLWRQLVNGIKKLFGIDVTDSGEGATTAFDVLNKAIETILDNFDPVEYANYRSNPYSQEHEMNLFDLDTAEKPKERQTWVQKSLFDETQTAAKAAPSKREERGTPEEKQADEENPAAVAANRAIDEYAERFAEIWGQYEAFIDERAEIADDLADRLEG